MKFENSGAPQWERKMPDGERERLVPGMRIPPAAESSSFAVSGKNFSSKPWSQFIRTLPIYPRPEMSHRRATPPVFLPNFDVPTEVSSAIRNGEDILSMLRVDEIARFLEIFGKIEKKHS